MPALSAYIADAIVGIVVFISVIVTMLVRSVLANMGSPLLLRVCGAVFGAIVLIVSIMSCFTNFV